MMYAIIGLIVLASIGVALYTLLQKSELEARISALRKEVEEQELSHTVELQGMRSALAKLEKLSHIPDVIERAKKTEREIAAKLVQSQREADEIVLLAHKEVEGMKVRIAAKSEDAEQRAYEIIQSATQEANSLKSTIIRETENDSAKAKEARKVAEWQANNIIEEAEKKAKEIASQARKEAKEKTQKVEDVLNRASVYALEIRGKAEARAVEIGGKAYEALKRHDFYEAAAQAMKNVVSGYDNTYMVPASHILDELAEEYGFHQAGERLRSARDRTRIMEKNGLAATCNYPEGWKREYAIKFVLGAFNGKVDAILARVKPVNQGKLLQEIKDVYAMANHNGEVFKNARIHEEYLDARLEELKWAVSAQRVKEKAREEQRAIREQMREEERARKEYEQARKQAEREEETLNRALEKARQEYAGANAEDRAKFEVKLQDLEEKLREAEEKKQRAISMAQQTKKGNVYVISNIGAFGEDIYKIGLTRRREPLDRVGELGSASVPFPFDVHAMIPFDDAPALETALHRRFLQNQVNKMNRRKEFFRLRLQDIRCVIEEMKIEVKWTMVAEATQYRETLDIERRMREDPGFRKRWTKAESDYQAHFPFDDEDGGTMQEDEDVTFAENVQS